MTLQKTIAPFKCCAQYWTLQLYNISQGMPSECYAWISVRGQWSFKPVRASLHCTTFASSSYKIPKQSVHGRAFCNSIPSIGASGRFGHVNIPLPTKWFSRAKGPNVTQTTGKRDVAFGNALLKSTRKRKSHARKIRKRDWIQQALLSSLPVDASQPKDACAFGNIQVHEQKNKKKTARNV